jgi:hypothetical protein
MNKYKFALDHSHNPLPKYTLSFPEIKTRILGKKRNDSTIHDSNSILKR